MPRGGSRKGTPGTAYSNRTDLAQNYSRQAGTTTAASGGKTPPPAAAPAQPAGLPTVGSPGLPPEAVPNLTDPSSQPTVPITDGMPMGPGAGPEALGPMPAQNDPVRLALQSMMLAFPSQDVVRMIERYDQGAGQQVNTR